MSKGNKVVSAGAVALALVLAFTVGVNAVTVSGGVAGQDNLAPDPPSDLQATLVGAGATLEWLSSPSDFVRQAPTGLDFTSGGTFSNVNDVAAYIVSRSDNGGDFLEVGRATGETEFTDAGPIAGTVQYQVTAADAAGNESAALLSLLLSVGAEPDLVIAPDADIDFGVVGAAATASETITVTNESTEDGAIGSVLISVEGDGFSTDVATLTVGPGASGEIVVSFSGVDVDGYNGTYTGTLTLRTNDSGNRETVMALAAEVTDGLVVADISVPTSILFGRKLFGTSTDKTLTITNQGDADLDVSSIVVTGDGFSLTPASALILGGASADVTVTFAPAVAGNYTGTVTITSDDPDEDVVTVSLSGTGLSEPDVAGIVTKTVVQAEITLDLVIDHTDPVAVAAVKVDFIAALAAFLGIDPSRITITAVTEGSVVIEFEIAEADTTVAQPEITAAAALVALTAAVADPAVEPVAAVAPAAAIVDETTALTLSIVDSEDSPIVGWFTRGGTTVGFNDFFAFADRFGAIDGQPLYDVIYDIAPAAPDGSIGFDDFFRFADDFGKTVANAAEVRAFLGLPAEPGD